MNIFSKEKTKQIEKLILKAKQIVIVAHKSPDGDSVGSSVGLFHYLLKKGKHAKVSICHPDPAPHFLDWLKGSESIKNGEQNLEAVKELIQDADLIFCLDFNVLSRTGNLEPFLKESSATKVVIDHHQDPSNEFDFVFSDTSSCATAQLIADFIVAMEDENLLDKNISEALYCGIMTDSGSFRFPSVTAHTHEVVALLMKSGLKPYVVHESVFDNNTFDKLRMHSFAINEQTEIIEKYHTAIIYLNKKDLDRFNYVKGDTEGLVNVGLSILEIKRSILLIENDGIIKISFRSKGEDNPVNKMASQYFSGGGHKNAAGGRWLGSMEEAIQKVKSVLPEFG